MDLNLKKRMKNFSLKEQYVKSWDFIKESRRFIYSILAVFVVAGIIGFFLPPPSGVEEKIMEYLKQILQETKGLGCLEMIRYIFSNNLLSGFAGLFLGVFFGLFPLYHAVLNGYVLGFVSSMSVTESGAISLWRILPHGIFELPAVFISLGLGVKLGSFVFHKNIEKKLVEFLKNSFRVFVFIILPLLIIAGIIEGFLVCSDV